MEAEKKVISQAEVQAEMFKNLRNDQEHFSEIIKVLKHGQKERLLNAMAVYPIQDINFENEPELESANIVSKRISDTLVSIATEHVVQSMVKESVRQSQELGIETQGADNE